MTNRERREEEGMEEDAFDSMQGSGEEEVTREIAKRSVELMKEKVFDEMRESGKESVRAKLGPGEVEGYLENGKLIMGRRPSEVERREIWQRSSFPIQATMGRLPTEPFRVPLVMAEKAFETYERCFGRGQTLERLRERGGFGWSEFCLLFCNRNPAGASHEMTISATHVVGMLLVEMRSG